MLEANHSLTSTHCMKRVECICAFTTPTTSVGKVTHDFTRSAKARASGRLSLAWARNESCAALTRHPAACKLLICVIGKVPAPNQLGRLCRFPGSSRLVRRTKARAIIVRSLSEGRQLRLDSSEKRVISRETRGSESQLAEYLPR